MRAFVQETVQGIRAVLRNRVSLAIMAALWLVIMATLVALPAARVVGNDVLFQLRVFRPQDWLLLALLSLIAAYAVAQSVFLWRFRRCHAHHAAAGTAAGVGAVGGALLALVTCPACLLGLAGFLSAGTLALLSAWRGPIVGVVVALTLGVVLVGARRAGKGVCEIG
ncbi:MAG: hypothetical protein KatS3mg099_039 [Candidatus Parcubacteria bacterium]|nr:MAG: hypothetical protein KatS3mg099_039 [Candidatus Parcubacteria bacterium]